MKKLTAALICALFLLSSCAAQDGTAAATDGITAYLLKTGNADSVQSLLDGYLCEYANSGAEWYAYSFNRCGDFDFSSFAAELEKDCSPDSRLNASQREKTALILLSMDADSSYAAEILDSSAFELGLMSRIFALHLINNDVSTATVNADSIIPALIELKKADGGWALTGEQSDVDCTAMVIQALAPYYSLRSDVKSSVDTALELLSSRQLDSGNFKSYGQENSESTAQVITALTCLGINPDEDSRFLKNGKSPTQVLSEYRLPDGSFEHVIGGGSNATATVQAFSAFVSIALLEHGQSYYVFTADS